MSSSDDPEEILDFGVWWVIHQEVILQAIRRAHEGEDPYMLMLELQANSEPGEFEDDQDEPPCYGE